MHFSARLMMIFQYIFWFFLLNLFTIGIGGLPALIFYLAYGVSGMFDYFPIFILTLIPLAPAFVALHFAMMRFVAFQDIHLIRDFWRIYRRDFWMSIRCAMLLAAFAIFIGFDFAYLDMIPFGFYLTPLLIVATLFLILVLPFLFTVISRYKLPFIQTFQCAFSLMFNNPLITAFHFVFLLFMLILFDTVAGYASAFFFSVWAFIHMKLHVPMLEKIEGKKFTLK
ncbi:MAG: hypothetical protein ACRDAO_01970 [Culicoidibacterales bacterium]